MTSFARNCNILLILSIFKCIRQNEWQVYYFLIISIQFLIISTTPTSSKEEESDELLYTGSVTRYGPRNPLPAQAVNRIMLIWSCWILM